MYVVCSDYGEVISVTDTKDRVRTIIEKLTANTTSVFSEKVYNLAADVGIGDMLVLDCLQSLKEDRFISEPVMGVLKRV